MYNDDEYTEAYARAQEDMEDLEEYIEQYAATCYRCGKKIMPGHTGLSINGRDYFCESHLDENSGDDLAIWNGADPDKVARYREIFD